MKAFLMFPKGDFDLENTDLSRSSDDLIQDLELENLLAAMGGDDDFIVEVARKAILSSLADVDTILYRQSILRDCIDNSNIITKIYQIAEEAIEKEKHSFHFGLNRASILLNHAVGMLEVFVDLLKRLRNIADEECHLFKSPGFSRFFSMLQENLDDEYFATVAGYLKGLKFRHGVLFSAELGRGNKGVGFILRRLPENRQGVIRRLFSSQPASYHFQIAPRDESGARALDELRNRGLDSAADAVGQSSDHILSFFKALKAELAFYIGSINLYRTLKEKGEPVCFPEPRQETERICEFESLYDVCLSLKLDKRAVGNSLAEKDINLTFITGANQGGKSTFLRSIGLAHLMMQSGLFVGAENFRSRIASSVFTHYRREEDSSMRSGKFEEELVRMSDIIDEVKPHSVILFNESFSSTNEREGSEIARQIVDVLLEKNIQVYFVTHFYELASAYHDTARQDMLFLRADREEDGTRTFSLNKGAPLPTSHGEDLYNRIFGDDKETSGAEASASSA